VFDVSGAGDTVMAVLASATAAGVPIIERMRMANHAAGIVVSKMGTASVTRDEMVASLAAEHTSPAINDGRFVDLEGAGGAALELGQGEADRGVRQRLFRPAPPGSCSR
jgi:D-beta-D-heptose 7-phosphate kinase/D-beta-D-heptose 1-phosphate adenosyltransferase